MDKVYGMLGVPSTGESIFSSVLALNYAGTGTRATNAARYSQPVINQGSAIMYFDSAELGAQFLIQEAGVYFISAWGTGASGSTELGIYLNPTLLDTNPNGFSISPLVSKRQDVVLGRAAQFSGGNASCPKVSICVPLHKGDIIQIANVGGTNPNIYSGVCVTKLAPL
jgi:hypothetical protein